MKATTTILAASIAGLAGFGWTLATYTPPPRAAQSGWVEGSFVQSPNRWSVESLGDPAERVTTLTGYLTENPGDAEKWHSLGWAQRELGDEAGAVGSWERAAAVQLAGAAPKPDSGYFYNLACYRALAGDREGALESWGACVDAGWGRARLAERDPDLASIRGDPRFEEALKRIVPRDRGTQVLSAG